jgi:sensor c-di-GMP phosphodiesterase-like protein
MKLRSHSSLVLLCFLLLGTACNRTDATVRKPESLEVRRFNTFAQKSKLVFPAAKQYYIIVQPKICVSCVGYYLKEISSHIPKESKLIVIGKSEAQKEVLEYIDHPDPEYFSNFNSNDLDREPFMKSGIAYVVTNGSKVISAVVVNKSNLESL